MARLIGFLVLLVSTALAAGCPRRAGTGPRLASPQTADRAAEPVEELQLQPSAPPSIEWFLEVRRAVREFNSAPAGQVAEKAIARMGGPAQAAAKLRLYLLLPGRFAADRSGAAMVLAWCGRPAVPVLARALKDSDPEVRASAAWALIPLAREASGAVPALAEALSDPDWNVRQYSTASLQAMGPAASAAVPALIRALGDADPRVSSGAAGALGAIGPDAAEAVGALEEAARTGQGDTRSMAADALRKIRGKPPGKAGR